MAKKPSASPSKSTSPSVVPPPRSRREELLDALLSHTADPVHVRLLKAYRATATVEGAEQEFAKIIQEITDEA